MRRRIAPGSGLRAKAERQIARSQDGETDNEERCTHRVRVYSLSVLARNCSALRLGMKRYAPALTVTNRGSAEVRSRSGCAGIVMWLDGSSFRLLSALIGSLLSLSPPKRGLLHHVCCTNSNWLRMLALTQKK